MKDDDRPEIRDECHGAITRTVWSDVARQARVSGPLYGVSIASDPLGEYVPGVTETSVWCEHHVKIMVGTYLCGQEPTGEHPDCYEAYLAEDRQLAEEADREQWDEYYRGIM